MRSAKFKPNSVFLESLHYVIAICGQLEMDVHHFLSNRGFTLKRQSRSTKTRNEGDLVAQQNPLHNTERFGSKLHIQKQQPELNQIAETTNNLLKFILASYQDAFEKSMSKNGIPVEHKLPNWCQEDVFLKRCNDLVILLQVSLIVTDHIFRFTEGDSYKDFIPFCEKNSQSVNPLSTTGGC